MDPYKISNTFEKLHDLKVTSDFASSMNFQTSQTSLFVRPPEDRLLLKLPFISTYNTVV